MEFAEGSLTVMFCQALMLTAYFYSLATNLKIIKIYMSPYLDVIIGPADDKTTEKSFEIRLGESTQSVPS